MNKWFADKLCEEIEKQGCKTEQWICKENGGRCVNGDIKDLIDNFNHTNKNKYSWCRSANYMSIKVPGCSNEEYDKVFIFKDYVEVKIPKTED